MNNIRNLAMASMVCAGSLAGMAEKNDTRRENRTDV